APRGYRSGWGELATVAGLFSVGSAVTTGTAGYRAMELPLFSLFGLAVGLSMDCAAVAAARGLSAPRLGWRNVLWMSGMFGGFQAFMPGLGFLLGASIGPMVERWDHWIAFALLGGIGGKMILEAIRGEGEEEAKGDPFRWGVLFGLAVATSVDSFAAGIVLPM